jgi:hypothetical protein
MQELNWNQLATFTSLMLKNLLTITMFIIKITSFHRGSNKNCANESYMFIPWLVAPYMKSIHQLQITIIPLSIVVLEKS